MANSRNEDVLTKISNGNICLSSKTTQLLDVQIKVGNSVSLQTNVSTNQNIPIIDLLKTDKKYFYDIALILALSNGDIKLDVTIPEIVDTTIMYHMKAVDITQSHTQVLKGTCASLISKYDASNVESDIIKWLYKRHQNIGNEAIDRMRIYLQELNRTSYAEYLTKSTIPIITSFNGIFYNISSSLIADNYYLFACNSEEEIEEFVEEMVSIKFEGATHSLNSNMSCFRSKSTSGTTCIFLVGINNDWSYKISPVGLVCIDNIKPNRDESSTECPKSIDFKKNKISVLLPVNSPTGRGYVVLETKDFGGNGLSCNVNFIAHFAGDIKSISIKREGNLAKWLHPETKVINLYGQDSPFLFSYELHLEDGDNYVPIVITDLRGNTTEYKMNVPASFTYRDTHDVNIENNIYN